MAKDIIINLRLGDKEISAKLLNADKLVGSLRKNATKTSDVFVKWSVLVTGFNQAMQVGSRVLNVFNSFIDAYKQEEQALKKVEQGIRSTGGAAGFTADELKKIASELQSITTFGDEQILNDVTAQFLTFTNITGDAFERAQVAALNLSTVIGTDLRSTSIQLGKALNDPIQGLSSLRRVGVAFTDEQQEAIKTLVKQNDLFGAQTMILDELEKQYGGQAVAIAETWTGKIEQSMNRISDAQEQLGAIAAKIYAPIIENVADLTLGFVEWIAPMDKASDIMREQQVEFNSLTNLLMDNNIQGEMRNQIVETLNTKYKTYLGNLDLEKASMSDLVKLQNDFNLAFEEKIKLQAAEEIYAETLAKVVKYQKELTEATINYEKAKLEGNLDDIISLAPYQTLGTVANLIIQDLTNKLGDAKKEFSDFQNYINKEGLKLGGGTIGGTPPVITSTGETKEQKKEREKAEKEALGRKDEMLKADMDLMEIYREYEKSIIEESDELIDAESEKYAEFYNEKWTLMEEDRLREEEQAFNKFMINASREELLNKQIELEQENYNIMKQLGNKNTADQVENLKKQKQIVDGRIKNIKDEVAARDLATKQSILAGVQMYDSSRSLGDQLKQLARDSIKRLIAEAVATQIAKVITQIPFPFNIILAPAAGLVVAALFDKLIPPFATGGMIYGKRHSSGGTLINAEGGEFVVNRESTRSNIELLEAINSGRNVAVASAGGNSDVVASIKYLGDEIRNLKVIAKLSPREFDEGYNDYLLKKSHTG